MARLDRIDPIAALWRGFRQPWLLLLLGSLAILLVLGALIVPQVPPEIAFDVQATTRWLIGTSAEYGALGQLMLNIGLFDVIHSLLLRVIFGLIALVLAVHMGYLIGELIFARRITQFLDLNTSDVTEPLIKATPNSLYQIRSAVADSPSTVSDNLEQHLRSSFPHVERIQLEVAVDLADSQEASLGASQEASQRADQTVQEAAQDSDGVEVVMQERILAYANLWPRLLRLLLMLGLLTALIPLWLITTKGWELHPPPLAPGEQRTFESQGLDLRYITQSSMQTEEAGQSGAYPPPRSLEIRLGEETTTLPIPTLEQASASQDAQSLASNSSVSTRLQQVDVDAYIGPPGLLISTVDGQDGLVLPESSEQMASVGLIFPGVGNEKAVLLPIQGRALRIVRTDDENQTSYVVELIDRDGNAIGDPKQIGGTGSTTVDLQIAGTSLRFDAVPGVIVEAKYLPGLWVVFIALGLVIIGAVGYRLRTGYVLLQISPWPLERSIVIAQSDKPREIDAIRALTTEG